MDVSVPYVTWKRGVNYGKAQMNGFFLNTRGNRGERRKFLCLIFAGIPGYVLC